MYYLGIKEGNNISLCISFYHTYLEKIKNHDLIIMIDTLRATSTLVTLFHVGANKVYMSRNKNKFQLINDEIDLLIGEKNSKKIKNYHFDNSPTNILDNKNIFKNKNIFMCTSNGAKCYEKLNKNNNIIALSLLNINTTIEYIINNNFSDIGVVCAGTNNSSSLEDFYTAYIFITELYKLIEFNFKNDGIKILINNKQIKKKNLLLSKNAINLKNLKKEKDLIFCLKRDFSNIIPKSKLNSGYFYQ